MHELKKNFLKGMTDIDDIRLNKGKRQERENISVCVCVCVWEREREREGVYM